MTELHAAVSEINGERLDIFKSSCQSDNALSNRFPAGGAFHQGAELIFFGFYIPAQLIIQS
jgi:hypothetical protein